DRDRCPLGADRGRGARRGGRRGRGHRGSGAFPRRRPVPALAGSPARPRGAVTDGRLADKVALVVGGGSGMGRAGAVAMAAEGATVVVSDLVLDRAQVVAAAIAHEGRTSAALHVDVTDAASVEQLVAETVRRFGRIDALYHCAADVRLVNQQDNRLTEL